MDNVLKTQERDLFKVLSLSHREFFFSYFYQWSFFLIILLPEFITSRNVLQRFPNSGLGKIFLEEYSTFKTLWDVSGKWLFSMTLSAAQNFKMSQIYERPFKISRVSNCLLAVLPPKTRRDKILEALIILWQSWCEILFIMVICWNFSSAGPTVVSKGPKRIK